MNPVEIEIEEKKLHVINAVFQFPKLILHVANAPFTLRIEPGQITIVDSYEGYFSDIMNQLLKQLFR